MTSRNDNSPLAITIAGYPFDRVQGLGSRVPVEGCEARFEKAAIGDMNSHVFTLSTTQVFRSFDF